MEHWILNNILTFGLAFILTGFLIPQIIRIAYRKSLFDEQGERKVHHGYVPRLGGVAFVPAIIFAVLFVIGLGCKLGHVKSLSMDVEGLFVPMLFLICAMMLMFLVGLADDLVEVRYRSKFVFQGIAALLLMWAGLYVGDFDGLMGIHQMPLWASWVVTGIGIIYIVNALNLIDGIDGLASGLSAVAFVFYGVILYTSGEYVYSMVAWAGLGSLMPFLYFNVFGNPAKHRKIFMGDAGSLTLGLLLAFLAIAVSRLGDIREGGVDYNPIVMALVPILIPLLDVLRVVWHRARLHRSPFLPDKTHIHHKLLALGMTTRQALLTILCVSVLFMVGSVLLSVKVNINLIFIADVLIWIVGNVILTRLIRKREARLGENLYE